MRDRYKGLPEWGRPFGLLGRGPEGAATNKIANGMTVNTFAPETTCSRGHIVTFLYRDLAK